MSAVCYHLALCYSAIRGRNIFGMSIQETWKGLEAAVDKGLVRSIGFSNTSAQKIDEWTNDARIHPAILQACHMSAMPFKLLCSYEINSLVKLPSWKTQ